MAENIHIPPSLRPSRLLTSARQRWADRIEARTQELGVLADRPLESFKDVKRMKDEGDIVTLKRRVNGAERDPNSYGFDAAGTADLVAQDPNLVTPPPRWVRGEDRPLSPVDQTAQSTAVITGAQLAGDLVAQGKTSREDTLWDQFTQPDSVDEPSVAPVRTLPVPVEPQAKPVVIHEIPDTDDEGVEPSGVLKLWSDYREKARDRRTAELRDTGWDVPVEQRRRQKRQATIGPEEAREERLEAIRSRRELALTPVVEPTIAEAAQTQPLPVTKIDHQPVAQVLEPAAEPIQTDETKEPVETKVIPLKKSEKNTSKPEKKHLIKFDPKRGEAPVLHGITVHDAQVILNREVGTGPEQQQIRREMQALVRRAGELSERRALKWFDENTARNMYLSMLDHVAEPIEQNFSSKAQMVAYEKIRKQLVSYFQKTGKRSWEGVLPPSQIDDMAKFLHRYFGGYYDKQLGGMTKRGARNDFFKAAADAYTSVKRMDLMSAAA